MPMALPRPKRDFGKNPTDDGRTVRCVSCKLSMPRHLVNHKGVCCDCEEPAQAVGFSRSIVNIAAVKSHIKRGEHHNGNVL